MAQQLCSRHKHDNHETMYFSTSNETIVILTKERNASAVSVDIKYILKEVLSISMSVRRGEVGSLI